MRDTSRDWFDLHCHWVAGVDDGARTPEAGVAMLRRLRQIGFSVVVATPHMRPGLFDNDKLALERAFAAMQARVLAEGAEVPEVHLASEHFLDDVVFDRLCHGDGLPYPLFTPLPQAQARGRAQPAEPTRAVLLELPTHSFPLNLQARFVDLKRRGLRVVLAHPERYQPVWRDDECLTPLLDAGAHLLLDVCSLVGKYGRSSQRAAEKLLREGAYEAACSDAHRPEDVEIVEDAIEKLEALAGKEEAYRLLALAPRAIIGIDFHHSRPTFAEDHHEQ